MVGNEQQVVYHARENKVPRGRPGLATAPGLKTRKGTRAQHGGRACTALRSLPKKVGEAVPGTHGEVPILTLY
eukprot:8343373-Alexandrium_andersonii.AAC.1